MNGPMAHPCSDTGRLQSDISRLEHQMHNKADAHKIYDLESKCSVLQRQIDTLLNNEGMFLVRIENMENGLRELKESLNTITT